MLTLDDLEWNTTESGCYLRASLRTPRGNVEVWTQIREPRDYDILLINRNRGLNLRVAQEWTELDPCAAQSVLYHLLYGEADADAG